MANSDLKGKYYKIPQNELKHLRKILDSFEGSKKSLGYVRNRNAINNGYFTYENLKNILNILKSLKSPASNSGKLRYNQKLYNLNGGAVIEAWAERTLTTARRQIESFKNAQRNAGKSNAFIKPHEKSSTNQRKETPHLKGLQSESEGKRRVQMKVMVSEEVYKVLKNQYL